MRHVARDVPNVLASFGTTHRDLSNWGTVNEYAFEADQGVQLGRVDEARAELLTAAALCANTAP